jgi:hypothetical protein
VFRTDLPVTDRSIGWLALVAATAEAVSEVLSITLVDPFVGQAQRH